MLIPDLSPASIAWCALALLCGGLIKGLLGVGTPLLTVPMLALVLPAQLAVVLMAIPIVIANIWQTVKAPQLPNLIRPLAPTAIALMVGGHIGSAVLNSIDERTLLITVGMIIIAFTAQQTTRFQFSIPERFKVIAGITLGAISGLIGGISSMFGPLLILYLLSLRELNKQQFVSAISFLYLCAVLPWAVSLHFEGLLDDAVLQTSALATVPVAVGIFLGEAARSRISDVYFHRGISAVLLTSGISMIWQGLQR